MLTLTKNFQFRQSLHTFPVTVATIEDKALIIKN
jgi:hypothetical protein